MHDVSLNPKEYAILVSVGLKSMDREESLEHLDELEFLVETAGAHFVEKVYQERARLDSAFAVGSGKVEEIRESVEANEVSLVIFDNDLSPAQVRNLERELKVKVMDRSGIILDIFAAHARTMEAKTQVELAQLQYMLPRLTRMWTHLSKQFGGIGTKGPGETQIETDRRLVRTRISQLKEKLDKISTQREQQRKGRETLPRFALVGYTNAGKSTLMNILSGSEVLVEDKLFATLDTTVRGLKLPNGKPAILSDTVGFIRKLPSHLIASFRSTLAETLEADVLLHVVDVSHRYYNDHIQVVKQTLEALGAHEKPTLMVFNKIDALDSLEEVHDLRALYENSVAISAARGINIGELQQKMMEMEESQFETYHISLPYTSMNVVPSLYKYGEVLERRDEEHGVEFTVRAEKKFAGFFERLHNNDSNDNK